jgi:nickel-dependent lactate racemase
LRIQSKLNLRTGAWYGDHELELKTPDSWDVAVLWPSTPPPISKDQIVESLQRPVGQAPIQSLCKGKSRPLIVVDDLNRPTPAEPIMDILLEYFQDAHIPLTDVTILMASGSHGKPTTGSFRKKVGTTAAESCRLLIHDCFKGNVKIGKTSFDTPVYVNRAVLNSDFVIGIGGIYPNYTAGLGGGTKLALGVLGIQSIFDLHFRHKYCGWGQVKADGSFRRDLNEIANMIGLNTAISVQINPNRKIIRVDCGDPQKYYLAAADFCRQTFSTLFCNDADVIISNTYPCDLSLTFAQMKGFEPFTDCNQSASRIAIASCDEGTGLHNIFPFLNVPRFHKARHLFRVFRAFGLGRISKMLRQGMIYYGHSFAKRISSPIKEDLASNNIVNKNPIWLYRPGKHNLELPMNIPGIQSTSQWENILQTVKREQKSRERLKVIVYPCAYLQILDRR